MRQMLIIHLPSTEAVVVLMDVTVGVTAASYLNWEGAVLDVPPWLSTICTLPAEP